MNREELTISIVIITYNRPDDMLDLTRNIIQLEDHHFLSEIVIVNNRSTVSYEAVEALISKHQHLPFQYEIATENLGVSRGRNYAIKKTTGDVLVFLDDDALFETRDALNQIVRIFTENKDSRPVGVSSFKVFYHSTMEWQKNAFPHKQFEEKKALHHFETAYFVGCAHAIRSKVFEKTGYYPENFFYGMEEYDLSYRVLDSGYAIVYDDRVLILHKESPEGRLTNREKLRGMWVNKSKVAWKYLPKKFFYSTALLWSYEYLRKTGFHFAGWLKGWKEVFAIKKAEQRKPLQNDTLSYLQKVDARLHY
jgi:GT2 family glycosyltransferase